LLITSSIHLQEFMDVIFQLVGQGERISISENPVRQFDIESFLYSFFVLFTLAGEFTMHLSTYVTPFSCENIH